MLDIRALREAEQWTGPSIVLASILLLAGLAILIWLIYRYLRD